MKYFVLYRSLFPTVKALRLVLCLAVLLSGPQLVRAQVADYADSAVEAAEAPVVDEEVKEDTDTDHKITIPQPLEFRQVPDSTVHSLKKDKDFAYANDPAYWAREPERRDEPRSSSGSGFWNFLDALLASTAIKTIAYGILIAFFIFVVYRIIVVNKLFLFYNSKKGKAASSHEAIDIEDDNLEEKIQKAVAAKEHRQAVRFLYLKALQLLNEKQWIRYHADATNYEYVNQMSGHKLGGDFSFLTRVYDYVWYGEFTLTEEQFEVAYKNFSHFYNAVKP